jgi:hypothetical protein
VLSDAESFGICWTIWFRFAQDRWVDDRTMTDRVVDAVAQTAWWPRMSVVGVASMPGRRRGSIDNVKDLIAKVGHGCKGSTRITLAEGDANAAQGLDTASWFAIDVMPSYLQLGAEASGEALRELGSASLSDVIALSLELNREWKDRAHFQSGVAFPTGEFARKYPPVLPRHTADRPLHAVVDVLDPTFEAYDGKDWQIAQTRVVAAATPPSDVSRSEHDGVIVMRWIDDPRDPEATMTAARHHETWMRGVIETRPY